MRRVQSAMLGSKPVSAIQAVKTIASPLKLVAFSNARNLRCSPVKMPSVEPPSEAVASVSVPFATYRTPKPLLSSYARSSVDAPASVTAKNETPSPPAALDIGNVSLGDLPFDLQALLSGSDTDEVADDFNDSIYEALISQPGRKAYRGALSPNIELGQDPGLSTHSTPESTPAADPSFLTFGPNTSLECPRDSFFNEIIHDGECRQSFDFSGEYDALNQLVPRRSFLDQLDLYGLYHEPGDESTSPLPPNIGESMDSTTLDIMQFEDVLNDVTIQTASPARRSPARTLTEAIQRSPPFMGSPAFQQQITYPKHAPVPAGDAPSMTLPPRASLPAAPLHISRRHRRDASAISIMTMSSIGDVIDTGIAGDYTNHFKANFAEAITANEEQRNSLRSTASRYGRETGHHRSTCVSSLDSIDSAILAHIATVSAGPRISFYNSRPPSSASHHRRSLSRSSAGRAGWAAHPRSDSSASISSVASLIRLGRPGLGERMFELDGGVKLTPITGSPPEDGNPRRQAVEALPRVVSELNSMSSGREGERGSLFSQSYVHDNLFGPAVTGSRERRQVGTNDADTVAEGAGHTRKTTAEYFAKSLHPVSMNTVPSSPDEANDTFIKIGQYAKRQASKKCLVLEASGEGAVGCKLFPDATRSKADTQHQLHLQVTITDR